MPQQRLHLSLTRLDARKGSSSEHLMRLGSMPYAELQVHIHPTPPADAAPITLHWPRTSPCERALFGQDFDPHVECHGELDYVLSRLSAPLRGRIQRALAHASAMIVEAGALRVTIPLYHSTCPAALCTWMQTWLDAHHHLACTADQSTAALLRRALEQERDREVAGLMLTTMLRMSDHDPDRAHAVHWALEQKMPGLHVIVATIQPKHVTPTGPLTRRLIAHTLDCALPVDVRTSCLTLLARHALDTQDVRQVLFKLSLMARSTAMRGCALTYALRLRDQPDGHRTALILSARQLVRQGDLEHELRKRLKAQLKHTRASADASTHRLLARDHIDHAMRYTSLSTLARQHLAQTQTVHTFLRSAVFDRGSLPRDFALDTLLTTPQWHDAIAQHHAASHTDPLERVLCAHILSRPYDLIAHTPERIELTASLILALHALPTQSPRPYATHTLHEAFLTLFHAHPETMNLCCTHPVGVSSARAWLIQLIPDHGQLILSGIHYHAGTYSGRAQIDAQDILFALLHRAPPSTHGLALDLLAPLLSFNAIEKLRALRTYWTHPDKRGMMSSTQCLEHLDRLIRGLTRSRAAAPGALSLSLTHHTTGALSPTTAHGSLSLADKP